ncbi:MULTISPECIES: hypothetical protein [Pantoea]|uniref:hypothetical protein n=1 Tax=Pantoea TaxID=53335 RepID=UPI003917C5B4
MNLTVSVCPKITTRQRRVLTASFCSAGRNRGRLGCWTACAGKVDTNISCQEKDDKQVAVLTQCAK